MINEFRRFFKDCIKYRFLPVEVHIWSPIRVARIPWRKSNGDRWPIDSSVSSSVSKIVSQVCSLIAPYTPGHSRGWPGPVPTRKPVYPRIPRLCMPIHSLLSHRSIVFPLPLNYETIINRWYLYFENEHYLCM